MFHTGPEFFLKLGTSNDFLVWLFCVPHRQESGGTEVILFETFPVERAEPTAGRFAVPTPGKRDAINRPQNSRGKLKRSWMAYIFPGGGSVGPRVMISLKCNALGKTGLKTAQNSAEHYKKGVMRAVFAHVTAKYSRIRATRTMQPTPIFAKTRERSGAASTSADGEESTCTSICMAQL